MFELYVCLLSFHASRRLVLCVYEAIIVTYYREAVFNNHPPQIAVDASTYSFSYGWCTRSYFSHLSIKEKIVAWLHETIHYVD